MGQNSDLIRVEGVSKLFKIGEGNLFALREIYLSIEAGEMVVIVGPSGSGKTTLLNMISGIDKPTSGTVRVDGVEVNRMNENKLAKWRGRNVGIVFQFFQLLPTLTALENIILPMEFRGSYGGKRRQRAVKVLDQVGLADHAHHLPSELSGGEQQRVAIARSIANDPPIILADEPTGNLDNETADEVFEAMLRLSASHGTAFVIVTHDPALAERAERVLELRQGVLRPVTLK